MFDKYQEAMMTAVSTVGERIALGVLLYRTSPGGVAGMSRTWSVVSRRGLLPRRVVYDWSTSTMGKFGILRIKFSPFFRPRCSVCVCVFCV